MYPIKCTTSFMNDLGSIVVIALTTQAGEMSMMSGLLIILI